MTTLCLVAASLLIWVLDADCECNSTARGELRGYDCFAWRACFYEIVQNAVGYCFVKGALIPIRSEIKLKGFAFRAEAVRNVIDIDPGKIGLAGDWTKRSEIVRFEMNTVIPTRRRIRESLEPGLGRGSWNFCFASSENCQSTCTTSYFWHGNINVRQKAIEVNRPYLAGRRADPRPRPDIR
jgi:hypothetical protein